MIPNTTAGNVLVVDDCEPLRELMEVILCRAGYQVLAAANGNEALHLARTTPQVDLLLSDLEMPGMRGEELATHFARLHPEAPVVFVSSSGGPIQPPKPFEFVAKPFSIDTLREAVRRALETRPALATTSEAA
jgi:CheY-like chemotaxis protein